MIERNDLRNIAIIAHVDLGKTTLVDFLLRQVHTFVRPDSRSRAPLVKPSIMRDNILIGVG